MAYKLAVYTSLNRITSAQGVAYKLAVYTSLNRITSAQGVAYKLAVYTSLNRITSAQGVAYKLAVYTSLNRIGKVAAVQACVCTIIGTILWYFHMAVLQALCAHFSEVTAEYTVYKTSLCETLLPPPFLDSQVEPRVIVSI